MLLCSLKLSIVALWVIERHSSCIKCIWPVKRQWTRFHCIDWNAVWGAEGAVPWELCDVLAVDSVLTPTWAGPLNLRGNTSRRPRCEPERMQRVRNNLVMTSFHQKGDISLRSQHAYYSAPSFGLIKSRWKTFYMSRMSLVKITGESFVFNDRFEIWSLGSFMKVLRKLVFPSSHWFCIHLQIWRCLVLYLCVEWRPALYG